MTISLLFWIIMIIGALFGVYTKRANIAAWATDWLVVWVLFFLLGWAVFGAAVHR